MHLAALEQMIGMADLDSRRARCAPRSRRRSTSSCSWQRLSNGRCARGLVTWWTITGMEGASCAMP